MSLALIWPANPRAVADSREADPEVHRQMLRKQRAVYRDSMPRRDEIVDPLNGYVYLDGAVRYRCRVERMINRGSLLRMRDEHQYVPSFRRQCLFGEYENGTPHRPSETWIKLRKIEPLSTALRIGDLLRMNGQRLRAVVGGVVYIQDPIP